MGSKHTVSGLAAEENLNPMLRMIDVALLAVTTLGKEDPCF